MGLMKNEFLTKKRYWVLTLTALFVAFSFFSVSAYQDLNTPKYVREKQSVELYTLKGGYDYHAVVIKENPIWPVETRLDNQPIYFSEITPELKGRFYFQINSKNPIEITADYQLKRILSSSGKDVIYWSKEEIISSGKGTQTEFQLKIPEIEREIRAIRESLNFYGGEIEVRIITSVVYQGKIGDEKVKEKKELSLLIKPRGSYYEVSAKPLEETVKKEIVRTVAIPHSNSEKARLIGTPAILFLAIVGLAVIKLKYKPLSEDEIEGLKRQKEHQRFREQISIGKYPDPGLEKKTVEISALKDLVMLAIDMDKRVIYDKEKEIYFVIAEDILYLYKFSNKNKP